jgi:hypothetical protein
MSLCQDPISTDRVNWDDEADTEDDEADTKDDEADTKDDEADNKAKGSKRARSGADDASDSDGGKIKGRWTLINQANEPM